MVPPSVIVAGPGKGPEERVRLAKLIEVIRSLGWQIEYWGWERGVETSKPDPELNVKLIHRGGGYGGKAVAVHLPLFMMKLAWRARFKSGGRPIIGIQFDCGLPLALSRLCGGPRFLFDYPDNFSMIHSWPGPIRKAIQCLERFAEGQAEMVLYPGRSRIQLDRCTNRVIPNTPHSGVLQTALRIARDRNYERTEPLTLYVNGRLVAARGVQRVLEAYRILGPEHLHLLVAGRAFSPESQELIQEPGVEYVGHISNEEALALYARADLTLTYYDPSLRINRLAEPNKWGDCAAMGVPFIVNQEVETAEDYIQSGACFSLPFASTDALVGLLQELKSDPSKLVRAREALAQMRIPAWDEAVRELLLEFLPPTRTESR